MKREILFRGKRIDNGEWEYGYLVVNEPTKSYRIVSNFGLCWHGDQADNGIHGCSGYIDLVIPETLGQFTGLTDKNGVKIFEGDIINKEMEIRFNKRFASFSIVKDGWAFAHYFGEAMEANECEITGNIHDNDKI